MDLIQAFRAIRQNKWTFLAATVLALLFLIYSPTETPKAQEFASSAKVLLTPPTVVTASANLRTDSDTPVVQSWFNDENTLRELVASEELLTRVLNRLQLSESWSDFRNRIYVQFLTKQAKEVSLFQITVTAPKPELSQQQTLVLVEEFVKYVQELSAREYASTRRFLTELVAEANTQVKRSQQALLKVRAVPTKPGEFTQTEMLRKADAQAERTRLSQEVSGLRAELEGLRGSMEAGGIAPYSVLSAKSAQLDGLREAITKEKARLDEFREVYLPDTEEVKGQQAALAAAEKAYNDEVNRLVESLVKEKEAILAQKQASLEVADTELVRLAQEEPTLEDKLQYAQRERQLSIWQENYLTLNRRLYEARVSEQLSKRQGAFSILERPQPGVLVTRRSSGKVRPLWQRYAVGIPFCFLFGAGVVFLQDYLRNSLRLHPKIEEELGLPVLGMVPRLPPDMATRWERLKRRVGMADDSNDSAKEEEEED